MVENNLVKRLFIGGIILGSLFSCKEYNKRQDQTTIKLEKEELITKDYFAEIPMRVSTGMAMTNGDFDNDGDLDLIIGAKYEYGARIYFYENDGKGNFKLRKYQKE